MGAFSTSRRFLSNFQFEVGKWNNCILIILTTSTALVCLNPEMTRIAGTGGEMVLNNNKWLFDSLVEFSGSNITKHANFPGMFAPWPPTRPLLWTCCAGGFTPSPQTPRLQQAHLWHVQKALDSLYLYFWLN